MISSYKYLRLFASILSIIFLLQSCSIYQSENLSLEKASKSTREVRITTNDGEKLKFKRIEEEDGDYYGLVRLTSKTSKVLQEVGLIGRQEGKLYAFDLEKLEILQIQQKNQSASVFGTIGIVVGGILIIISIIAAISVSINGIF